MSTKDILLEIATELPPNATLADAIQELEFRQAVQQGLDSLDAGRRMSLEDTEKMLPEWISKYSSLKKQ